MRWWGGLCIAALAILCLPASVVLAYMFVALLAWPYNL